MIDGEVITVPDGSDGTPCVLCDFPPEAVISKAAWRMFVTVWNSGAMILIIIINVIIPHTSASFMLKPLSQL